MSDLYDPATALVVTDVQNDFADPRGSLFVRGGEEVVAAANAEIIRAVASGALVVYTKDWHPPDTPHFQKDGGVWPVHCVHDTWGAELHPRLIVAGPMVHKGTGGEDGYSGFSMRHPVTEAQSSTGLHEVLSERGVTKVVVVGLALDYCVRATALDARELGFVTVLPRRATAPVELQPGDGKRATDELLAAGVAVA